MSECLCWQVRINSFLSQQAPLCPQAKPQPIQQHIREGTQPSQAVSLICCVQLLISKAEPASRDFPVHPSLSPFKLPSGWSSFSLELAFRKLVVLLVRNWKWTILRVDFFIDPNIYNLKIELTSQSQSDILIAAQQERLELEVHCWTRVSRARLLQIRRKEDSGGSIFPEGVLDWMMSLACFWALHGIVWWLFEEINNFLPVLHRKKP